MEILKKDFRVMVFTACSIFILVISVDPPIANAASYPLCGTQAGPQFCVFSNSPNSCSYSNGSSNQSIPVINGKLPSDFSGQIPGTAAYACSQDGNYFQFFNSNGSYAGGTTGVLGPFSSSLTGTTNFDANNNPLPSVCTQKIDSWNAFFNTACWGPLLSGVISGALVAVASWLLTVAGILFNWALYETVFQFGHLINCGAGDSCNSSIIDGINTAWSVFRDLSNIIIIGMFTFIAIATILGNTDYGYKKMLSRVLIVAVLINFSLLFSKIIIDVSNFTATQFATAIGTTATGAPIAQTQAAAGNTTNLNATNPNQASQQAGVAGVLIGYAGLQGFGDTATAVFNLSKNPQGGAWLGLLYGIVTAVLFFTAAVVLFYGTFLLVTRALVMLLLMITASIAFASYLLPSNWTGNYGWGTWWQSLLRNAVFAPFLVAMLWVTLTIGGAFKTNSGSLGDLVANSQKVLNINALFSYLIIIGLLFASFKISSSLAGSVAGLSIGNDIFNKFRGLAGSGTSGIGSLAWRQTGQRFANRRSESLTKEARDLSLQAANARRGGDEKRAKELERQVTRAALKSSRWAGYAGGYKKSVDERAKKVSAVLGKAEPSSEKRNEQVAAAEEVRKAAASNASSFRKELEKSQEQTKELASTIETAIKSNSALLEEHEKNSEPVREAEDNKQKALEPLNDRIKELRETMARGGINQSELSRLHQQLSETQQARESELRHQDQIVEHAHREALLKTANSSAATDVIKQAAKNLQLSQGKEADLERMIAGADAVQEMNTKAKVREAQAETTNAVAGHIAAKQTSLLGRAVGVDKEVTASVRTKVKKEHEDHGWKNVLKKAQEELKKDEDGGGGHEH